MKKSIKILSLFLAVVILGGSVVMLAPSMNFTFPDFGSLFERDENANKPDSYTLQIAVDGEGTVDSNGGTYQKGETVNLTATPGEGHVFAYWSDEHGKILTSYMVYSLIMNRNTKLIAHFTSTPKELVANNVKNDVLMNRAEDYAFVVECDHENAAEFLQDNLTVVPSIFKGTEYEDAAKAEFDVVDLGDNKFQIKPKENYQPGMSYSVEIPANEDSEEETPNVSFAATEEQVGLGENNQMSFQVSNDRISEEESMDFLFTPTEDDNNENNTPGTETPDDNPGSDTPSTPPVVTPLPFVVLKGSQLIAQVDDGKLEGQEGDAEDYFILSAGHRVGVNTIICIHDGTSELTSGMPPMETVERFAKAKSVEELADETVKVVYAPAALDEIFNSLNMTNKQEADFEKLGAEVDPATIEAIKHDIMADEGFQKLVWSAQAVFAEEAKALGYELELINKNNFWNAIQVDITTSIIGDFRMMIKVNASYDVMKAGKKVATIKVNLDVTETYDIIASGHISLRGYSFLETKLNYLDVFTSTTRTSRSSMGITVAYADGEGAAFEQNLDREKLKANIVSKFTSNDPEDWDDAKDLRDIFKQNGFEMGGYAPRFLFAHNVYMPLGVMFSTTFNLEYSFDLDIAGSLFCDMVATSTRIDGLRSSGSKASTYSNTSEDIVIKNGTLLAGAVKSNIDIATHTHFTVNGFASYVAFDIVQKSGLYTNAGGYVSPETKHYAGMIEAGFDYDATMVARAFSWYDNSLRTQHITSENGKPLIRYGNTTAYLYYPNIKDAANVSVPVAGEVDLFASDRFSIAKMDIATMNITNVRLDPKSTDYTVDVKVLGGEYITYDAATGKLVVKAGAPVYFTDTVEVTVTANNRWEELGADSTAVCAYLPKLILNITHGSEYEYAVSLDNTIEQKFRGLYLSYNKANVDVLKEEVTSLIDLGGAIGDDYMDVYVTILNAYIGNLFDTIAEGRSIDAVNGNHAMEHKFVREEANSFKATLDMVKGMLDESVEIDEESLKNGLETILSSTVMYNVFMDLAASEEVADLADRFAAEASPEMKESVDAAIAEFEEVFADNARALELASAIRSVFGLTADPAPAEA